MANPGDVGHEIVDNSIDGEHFEPYIPASQNIAEFTVRAALIGTTIGVVFGVANAYLALRVGMTITASIPAAVIGIAILKILRKGTILESNMIQTMGSAGEALAAMVFTIPAFFIWGMDPGQLKLFMIVLFGGLIGILFMIPLRHYLIVKEHGKLTFPEGLACAEVLISHQEGGSKASTLFWGIGLGGIYQFIASSNFFGLIRQNVGFFLPGYRKAHFGFEMTPELLGIGFIIGPRMASLAFAGSALGSLVLVPLIAMIGANDPAIAEMSAGAIRGEYVRLIGAGAVGFAGLISVIKSMPLVYKSVVKSIKGLRSGIGGEKRTTKDMDMRIVLGGIIILILAMAILPDKYIPLNITGAICVTIFGFLFVAVSSRVAGMIGQAVAPVSGMAIATLLMTAAIFFVFGLTTDSTFAKVAILTVGSIVVIATGSSGDISQDLKTGFLVGATPYKQQYGQIIATIVCAIAMSSTIYLFKSDILSGNLQAPQANLMAMLLEGVIAHKLSWDLLIIGAVIAGIVEILGLPALAFALGLYLPFPLLIPIMLGGILRGIVTMVSKRDKVKLVGREEKGILYSSGLIAGAALAGVIITALVGGADMWPGLSRVMHAIAGLSDIRPDWFTGTAEPSVAALGPVVSLFIFIALAISILGFALKKK